MKKLLHIQKITKIQIYVIESQKPAKKCHKTIELCDNKSQTIVKNAQINICDVNICDENSQTNEKSHKNVSLCDKKPQTTVKKLQKCKLKR